MDGHTADAEDALSQVMLKVLDRLPTCAGTIIRPGAWLHRLARNLCIDLRRERQRRLEAAESWKITTLTDAGTEQPMLRVESESEIQQRIIALPPSLREPFILHVVREIPVKEVASQLGLSTANVRKRVQLARARLRRDLAGSQDGNGHPGPVGNQTPPSIPAKLPSRQSNPQEHFSSATAICTVRVKLPCGVEQLFHVFPADVPASPGRKMKALESFILRHPDSWEKRMALAELFQITGDWNKAVGEWQRVLAIQPHLPASLKLGDTLLKLGAPEEAADVFRQARRQDYQSVATARHLNGWIAFCGKNTAFAAIEFQAAADLEPKNPVHWHGLALAYRLTGNAPESLWAIQRALNLNPNDLAALSLGHEMLLAAGEVEEAVRRAQHLLNMAPLDLLTMRRLVDCRCQLGLTRNAAGLQTKRLLRRASRLSQNPFLMCEPLVAFFLTQDEPQKALAVQREFLEKHPQCPSGRQKYLNLLATTGLPARLPAEPPVWKLPSVKCCNGACCWHEKPEILHA